LRSDAPGPDLFLGPAGSESLLAAELADLGLTIVDRGPGRVLAAGALDAPGGPAFAHLVLRAPRQVKGASVNALALAAADAFLADLGEERIGGPWPCLVTAAPELKGLGQRAAAVRRQLLELLRRRAGRLARLATDAPPPGTGEARGLVLHLVDFDTGWLARDLWRGGQRRMADDPAAPSRSYLKIEEAYGVLGREPKEGESVVDLGAAPGGWSYSAARRGARVTAVDNGPLKGGALGHPLIRHVHEDAFGYRPPAGETSDWLFCDLVEEPHHVLENLVLPWLEEGRCRRFIVILKCGRADTAALLRDLRSPLSPLAALAPGFLVRHLYHDRDEITIMGRVAGGPHAPRP
jgi:23S rRNA (cytidine2498-2'-O)-methyltransferase